MKNSIRIIIAAVLLLCAPHLFAEENVGGNTPSRKSGSTDGLAAGCTKSTNSVNIDLNNVRAPIQMNGDMWWDLINNIARYEIPKGSGKTSLFAGAIWVGGKDVGGNLKLAAQTYRQSGVDYWPGPLDTTTASTSSAECLKYDRHWKLLRTDVQAVVNGTGKLTADMISWPGNGDPSLNEGHYLAPFHDVDGDGIYNPFAGDYPDFDLSQHPTCGHLYGDQNVWWVFNDEGNIHTETGGAPIGLEVRAQAFCFQTNDDINNCTFYNYQIINRSHSIVNDTWFGAWVDPDLGYAFDDYVGCDVGRGLGYVYNGEAFDPGTFGYGFNPPACGLDFFQGPIADPNDGIDNNRNGRIDEPNEEIIMSQFVYYNNDFTAIGNPLTATDYYNYMQGIWRDGTPITFGGNGHGGTVPTSFMFPGLTDPTNWGTGLGKNNGPTPPVTNWTESTAGDVPGDRRFLQSAGKFTLQAGAVNIITTGAVWARTTSGGPLASVALLQLADDKAQALFNNCFAITNGPDAPDMTIRELNQELILSIKPDPSSNDSIETNYLEKDPFITKSTDTAYHFQGYQIFQFANNSVSVTDIGNPDKARLVAQCDLKDSVSQIVNQVFQPGINAFVPTDEVDGTNTGLQHTFDLTTDAFASGTSTALVNHQTYYYCVVAYGFNAAEVSLDPYNPTDGHSTPYISGRRNVFTYTAIPHIPDPQDGGLTLQSGYGDSPMIQRIEGKGNGGLILDMTQQSINEALSAATNYRSLNPYYNSGNGPIDVQIYDPVAVGNHDFEVYFRDTTANVPTGNVFGQVLSTSGVDSLDGIIAVSISASGAVGSGYPCDTTTGPFMLSGNGASYTFAFSPPVDEVQINALFGATAGQLHIIKNNNVTVNVTNSILAGTVGSCSPGVLAVASDSNLTNVVNLNVYNNANNKIIVAGPLKNITISSADVGSINFGLLVNPYGNTKWYIKELATGQLDSSDQNVTTGNEKIFPQWGIKVSAQQVRMPGEQGAVNNGFLGATMAFLVDSTNKWLTGISNVDKDPNLGWIGYDSTGNTIDPLKVYTQVLGGTWAPFKLCSITASGPVYNSVGHTFAFPLDSLASVDIVLTSNKDLWSRCVVVEEDSLTSTAQGGAVKGYPRNHPSVDKNGQTDSQANNFSTTDPNSPDYINATGMGWFPGYAVCEETGERLNVMFGENSYFVADNGADMLFNPSPNIFSPPQFDVAVLGGMHYIYVMADSTPNGSTANPNASAGYDGCRVISNRLIAAAAENNVISGITKHNVWAYCMWVGLPLLQSGHAFLESDVKISLRVAKSYRYYNVGGNYSPYDVNQSGIPFYKFSTNGLGVLTNQTGVAKSALDLINIVPNPYYSYSSYETNQLDNRVKIVNLPNNCTVSIYTANGTLVRRYIRNVPSSTDLTLGVISQDISTSTVSTETNIDWDLKNSAGVPVAGGIYIIHVNAPGLGEKVIKWFGVIRPIDLDTF